MGRITKCIYKVVAPEMCSIYEAGEYYFNQNVLGLHEKLDSEYERYEGRQMMVRNCLIGEAIKENPDVKRPALSSVVFGASSTKNNVVLVAEI